MLLFFRNLPDLFSRLSAFDRDGAVRVLAHSSAFFGAAFLSFAPDALFLSTRVCAALKTKVTRTDELKSDFNLQPHPTLCSAGDEETAYLQACSPPFPLTLLNSRPTHHALVVAAHPSPNTPPPKFFRTSSACHTPPSRNLSRLPPQRHHVFFPRQICV